MHTSLGKRIAAYRKEQKLTQDQLAEKLGITAQAVSKWENDLSCPDITVLPRLADIFGVTTDMLLGREAEVPVCEASVVSREETEQNGFTFDNGKVNLHWDGSRLAGIGLACWILLTGALYLIAQLLHIRITFWDTLWPAFLLIFGLFGLYPKFSVFRLGCALAGGYFIMDKLLALGLHIEKGILLAVVVLLFGLSLLLDVLRKQHGKSRGYHLGNRKFCNDFSIEGNTFTYDASFGDTYQKVEMACLRSGHISTSFGDYTVDLCGVENLENNCNLHADCSFGELTVQIPQRYAVLPDSSTSFASFEIQGQPDPVPQGTIKLNADVSFGSICIRYI